jgi:uncharacterized protein
MLLRLDSAREAPVAGEETVEPSASELEQSGLAGVSAVATTYRLDWADPDYLLTLGLQYRQHLTCDRCLEESWNDVDTSVHFLVVRVQPAASDPELGEDDLGVVVAEDDAIDTRPLIIEQLALNAPMKPLCQETCRGLCPTCGADLNRETCSCTPESNPRWNGLRSVVRSP